MKQIIRVVILIIVIGCHPVKTRVMKIYNLKFDTQYNQFYIEDGSDKDKGSSASPEFWNEQAFKERLGLTDGIIGVGTQCYGEVKGEIEVLEKPNNEIDYSKYDHIVEGGINIKSGELQILDCPNNHLELSVKVVPGKYRVRVYSSNLASVVDDDGDDYYRIELWKSDEMERKVLKQYEQGF